MARLKFGILGPLIGKIANLVGYLRMGQPMVRTKPDKKRKKTKRSDGQKAVNLKFKLVKSFVSEIGEFIHVGYRNDVAKTDRIPENGAVSYMLKETIIGEYPNFAIDYSKVMVSRGKLRAPLNPGVTLEGNVLTFTWDIEPNLGYNLNRDQVMLMAYKPSTESSDYLMSGARRNEGTEKLEVAMVRTNQSNSPKDEFIETYIAFISDDRKRISDSVYVGRIEI